MSFKLLLLSIIFIRPTGAEVLTVIVSPFLVAVMIIASFPFWLKTEVSALSPSGGAYPVLSPSKKVSPGP